MAKKGRIPRRELGKRRYNKLFVLSVEGRITEVDYFNIFKRCSPAIHIRCLKKRKQSSPQASLKTMNSYLKNNQLRNGDEAWIVVDRDSWKEEHLMELLEWSKKKRGRGLAVSNPKFEYWLLLHFEDAKGIKSVGDLDNRLKKHIPSYDKKVDSAFFTKEKIVIAVERAKNQDKPPCKDWHRRAGTTVYRLVEKLLKECEEMEF